MFFMKKVFSVRPYRHLHLEKHVLPSPRGETWLCCRLVTGAMLQLLGIWPVNGWPANKGGRSALRASMVVYRVLYLYESALYIYHIAKKTVT